MWYILGIIVAAIGIVLYEVPNLVKNKLKKELIIFSALMVFAVILSIVESLNIDIPNPLDGIAILYKPISDLMFKVLE